MTVETSRRLMIADADQARRRQILSSFRGMMVIEAASMSEAVDLAERTQPHAIAISAELSGDPELEMLLNLTDAQSAGLVTYGHPTYYRTPVKFRKSIPFFDLCDELGEMKLVRALRGAAAPGMHGATGVTPTMVAGQSRKQPDLIVIGASTGGVSALETVLTSFPADCPPTLVVQHIRPGFIDGMIRRLNQKCLPEILAAEDAMRPTKGQVCVAADTERHLVLQSGSPMRCRLKTGEPRHGHRPSVDALFETAAERANVAAALLTGMGADGAEGMSQIKAAGGLTIAQNEATCVVYGMPRVAVEMGAARHVLPLGRIASVLLAGFRESDTQHRTESER